MRISSKKLRGARALITGGAGFIGSHLADRLLAEGLEVVVLDNLSHSNGENLAHIGKSVEFIKGDIADPETMLRAMKGAHFVFHLAAINIPRVADEDPGATIHTNINGTHNVLHTAVQEKVQKVIFTSTALLYDPQKGSPMTEDHPIFCESSMYKLSKRCGEELATFFAKQQGLPITFTRFFNIFGPRQTTDYVIPKVLKQALESKHVHLWTGKPTRDFTFVTDAVEALLCALLVRETVGPVNIGSGQAVTIEQMAHQVCDPIGADVDFERDSGADDVYVCCNQRAREVLGWGPLVSFERGVKETLSWWQKALPSEKIEEKK